MPRLIIGHIEERIAKVWVRGDKGLEFACLFYQKSGKPDSRKYATMALECRHDFTACFVLSDLSPSTAYICTVEFGASADTPHDELVTKKYNSGKFTTAPLATSNEAFKFMLGSCNLHSLGIFNPSGPAFKRMTQLAEQENAAFMIHCGDQIYYDIPLPSKSPDLDEYRDKYKDAWGDSDQTQNFLTKLPQYMILDDHEIINNFSNDMTPPTSTPHNFKDIALKAYREYQHSRHPHPYGNNSLYYHFNYGFARFFVMDTRTERYRKGEDKQIIGELQMMEFKKWLKASTANQVNFIITSVPFVGEVRGSSGTWSSRRFLHQRNEIIDYIAKQKISKVCFLTGDMHNSYYAAIAFKDKAGKERIIHELMSSPINQLSKSSLSNYHISCEHETASGLEYKCEIDQSSFYDGHSNIMMIAVTPNELVFTIHRTKRDKIGKPKRTVVL